MTLPRWARGGLSVVGAVLFLAASCDCQPRFKPTVSSRPASQAATGPALLIINGQVAARFLTSNGGLSPIRRAEIAAQRLNLLIESGSDYTRITGVATAAQGKIYGQTGLIFLVTGPEAKAQGSTVPALTQALARNIRYLLLMPPLKLERTAVIVPFGETRIIKVMGSLQTPFNVVSSNPEVAQAVAGDGRSVVISGVAPGDATVTVSSLEYEASAQIAVRKYAARLVPTPEAIVTGSPASSRLVETVAVAAALRSLALEPEARAVRQAPKTSPLWPGQRQSLKVRVKADGPGYLPVAGDIPVTVANLPLSRPRPTALMYSNNPERLNRYGTLFAAQLEPNSPARLLYHHQSALSASALFEVEIINTTSSDARIHVLGTTPDPIRDTVLIGYRAGQSFLRDYLNYTGAVIDVPSATKVSIYSTQLRPGDTVSGITELAMLAGESVLVHVAARPANWPKSLVGVPVPVSAADADLPISDHLYPAPIKPVEARYSVGGPWSFIRIGKEALKSSAGNSDKQLYGNYGVTYEINVNVENPTETPKTVQVLFEPSAGIACGLFWVDGEIIGTTHRKPPEEVRIASYRLQPNERKSVLIRTIPLSGSNYPATILVRS